MHRFVGICFIFLTAGVVVAADTHETLVKELLGTVKDAVGVLKTIKDDKTAKEAEPKVTKITTQMGDIKKRMDKIGKPTKEQEEELQKKYKTEMETNFKTFAEEINRVSEVPGGKDIVKLFQMPK
jgi:peptidoglycan hydrolase CwlO-like protein